MKGGAFLSKKGYDETKKKINEDYVFILNYDNSSLQKSYEKDAANEEEYELQYRAIICMLYFAEEIKTITVSSLYGFIFHVKSRNSYFKKLDIDGTTEIDVYDILLKCSIVTQKVKSYNFEVFESEPEFKMTETILSIKNEANEQQSIYIKMLKTGYIITPSVLDVSILKDKEQMETFFNILVHALDKNEITQRHVENIIKKAEELNGSLSVMTCEYLNDSDTISNLLDDAITNQALSTQNIEESLLRIYAYILVTFLELYVYCGIIHFDLHLDNIMAKNDIFDKKKTQQLKNRIYFIDYGRTEKIEDDFNTRFKKFFTLTDKGILYINWNEVLSFTWENYMVTTMLFSKFYGWSSYDISVDKEYQNYTSNIFRNKSFQKNFWLYIENMFNSKYIEITSFTKVGTKKRWRAMKFHKKKNFDYKEREQYIKEEKVLLNDFKDDLTTMIRGNVSIITKEEDITNMQDDVARLEDQPIRKQEEMKGNPIATGGKSNLTRKRSKKHHKKTQRRRR